jgi:DNA-binding PadR family transcriptional regulator
MAAEESHRGVYGCSGARVTFQAKKRDRIVAGHFTTIPASLFSSKVWEALSPTAMRIFGFMAGADADVHSGDGRVGFAYDDFVKRGVDRHAIAPALRELEEAGIIKRVWKGHGGENANARSGSFYRLTTYASDAPQAFLEPLTRAEWLIRLTKARNTKDLHHARNGKGKTKSNGVVKERNFLSGGQRPN